MSNQDVCNMGTSQEISPTTYDECKEAAASLFKRYVPGTNGLDKLILSYEKNGLIIQIHQQQRWKYCTFYEFYPDSQENAAVWQRMIDWLENKNIK